METQAACHAWEDVKGRFPNLRIRIFYCMGGRDAEDTYTVLSELPDEVKIERCYGQFGESFNRTATEGRWLASYAGPPLPKAEHAGLRFHGSSKTREYVNRLREQGWDAVYSINYVYSTGAYQRTLFDFHVHALAEWTWNTEGRQVSELGKAWATRKGYTRPDQVGQWIELMDPVEKALHYVISTRVWGRFPEALTQKMAIPPGRDLLAGFPHGKELVDYVDVCKRATKLAGEGNAPDLALESSYAAALCRLIEAVNSLFAIPESDESAAALLAGLRQAGNDMNRIFGERMSRVDAAPSAFAESTVKLHSELWGDRIASLTKAASAGK
ncbi:MAG: hypothetical protein HN406_25900 [Lentisphaerae bacterium]|nr:hypothetical protein [Lentisphaerota bacterium]